ncbi:hypothetical protein AMJ39_00925 [candidate division TA06 bacterium DG_24]|uniref:PEGA domain-containing protein n=2 Tax=Bacteria division TA06 TaxID=1156500 RepID=A0A0S8GJ33_UNCT6|nr:MAG: hypothetical protein AMJ39_00925 [candidate division TA06 bacterium DG_24]KPK71674.1 MAG: hypothetical protein AMJ82_00240 [candidate division TA06 bacterium SM23_40]
METMDPGGERPRVSQGRERRALIVCLLLVVMLVWWATGTVAGVKERPGVVRVMTGEILPPGRMWTSITGEWYSQKVPTGTEYTQSEGRGTASIACGLVTGWEASLSLPLRYYMDDRPDAQGEFGQGDLAIGLTAGRTFGAGLHVAANLFALAPVGAEAKPVDDTKTSPFSNDALQVGGGLLATYDFARSDGGIPLKTHFNARYLANFLELPTRPTTWNNLLLLGMAGEWDLGAFSPFVEISSDQPVHNYLIYASMAPIRLTPGVRFSTPVGADLTLGVDIGLSQELDQWDVSPEGFGPGYEVGDKLVPPWNAVGAVSVAFPAWYPPPPPYGVVTGQVSDTESGVPLEASISFPDTDIPSVSTDPSTGRFVVEVPEGSWKMVIAADDYLWRAGKITVARGGHLAVSVRLRSRERAVSTERAEARYATVSQLFAQAQELSQRGELYEAASLLQRAVNLAPDNVEVQRLLAQTEAAIRSQIAVHRADANSYESTGRWSQAAAAWRMVLQLDPENLEAHQRLVTIEQRRTAPPPRSRGAAGAGQGARAAAPSSGAGGQTGAGKGDQTALSSSQVRTLYTQGVRAFTEEQYQRAASCFRQVLQADPGHAGAKSYLARTEARLQRLKTKN